MLSLRRGVIPAIACCLSAVLALGACASKKHRPEDIETKMDKSSQVSGDTKLGVKDGNMVVQKKVLMNEELRRLQNEVYEMEDHVYGNRKYGSLGLYGVLRDCRTQLADKENGGSGKLQWTEPMERITDKEEDMRMGFDEKKDQLVGVSEEMLKDRIDRFRGYKNILMKRQDEYEDKVAICKNDLKNRKAEVRQ